MRAAAIGLLAAVAFAGCTVKQLPEESAVTPAPAPRETPAEAPDAAEVIAAAPDADEVPAATPAEYERALDHFDSYCWSDCSQSYYDRWEYHLGLSDPDDLRTVVVALASLSFYEMDAACDEFWETEDVDVVDLFDGLNASSVLTAFYYVCDT